MAIVAVIVDPHFEALVSEPVSQFPGNLIRTFRDEIERRAETHGDFQLGQLLHPLQAPCRFYVVHQDESELLLVWPSRPAFGGGSGGFQNRPLVSAPGAS